MTDYQMIAFAMGFFVGPGLALIATPVFIFLQKLFYVPLARKKMLKKAIAKGNVVTAYLVKSNNVYSGSNDGTMGMTPYMHGYYRYEYRGKSYTYWAKTANTLPEQITLYFKKKPRKACLASEFGLNESNWIVSFLIMSVIMCVVVWIVGMNYVSHM